MHIQEWKALKEFPRAFGKHLTSMNILLRKRRV
jgi:hypothetical protein